jgi:hypothetical protein
MAASHASELDPHIRKTVYQANKPFQHFPDCFPKEAVKLLYELHLRSKLYCFKHQKLNKSITELLHVSLDIEYLLKWVFNSYNRIRAMSKPHRPDCLLKLYLVKLRTTDVIVVLVKLGLEADCKAALCRGQRVSSSWTHVVDARNTIDCLAAEECICLSNYLQNVATLERAIRNIQLRSQQMTCQTTNRVVGLATAAVHCVEDFCHLCECIHVVVA